MNKIEKIWWYDPTGHAQWYSMDNIKKMEPARCVTVAQVIYETKQWIVTSASFSNLEGCETEYADITIIPKGCIERRQVINTQIKGKNKDA